MSQNPLEFKGRIGSRSYALSFAILAISGVCIGGYASSGNGNSYLHEGLAMLASLAWICFGCVQAAKRARDAGWSGWWGLVTAIPVVQFIAWLVFLAVRGDANENRFGPAASAQSSHNDRVFLWVLLLGAALLIVGFGALWMIFSKALNHMNG